MELTDQQFVDIEKKMLALPGVDAGHESSLLIEDGWGKNDCETYIKCMSDHGVTDDQNGIAIAAYLVAQGCVIEHNRPRSMMVQTVDLVRLFT